MKKRAKRKAIQFRPLTEDEEVRLVARVQKVLEKHVPDWTLRYPLTAEGLGVGKDTFLIWQDLCEVDAVSRELRTELVTTAVTELQKSEFVAVWRESGKPFIIRSEDVSSFVQNSLVATLDRPIFVAAFPPYDVYYVTRTFRLKSMSDETVSE